MIHTLQELWYVNCVCCWPQGKTTSELGKTGKFKEEKIVYSTPTAVHVNSQLTVRQVEVGDSGEIVCVAISGAGSTVVTSKARLVVLRKFTDGGIVCACVGGCVRACVRRGWG